ncbi:MAG: hypothetical protein J6X25_09920 [Bacteroidales bacterium]|nr:hypothetical protein [Bacteroidales bacterium]
MKLKAIFTSVIAAAALLVSCTEEPVISSIEGLTIDKDYITLAAGQDGQTVSGTVKFSAPEDWTAEVSEKGTWLTVSPASGKGEVESTITLTAQANTGSVRSTEVYIKFGNTRKIVKVNQDAPAGVVAPESTCKDVIEGDSDKVYKITGTITKISNTHFGNMYINDGTVDGDGVYIYGTKDRKGQPNPAKDTDYDNLNDPSNPNSWDLAVGDKITVQGPKTVYNGTVELVDVEVVKVEKSLIQIAAFDFEILPAEGQSFEMTVDAKVSPLLVSTSAEWLKVTDVKEGGVYVLTAEPNTYTAIRTATITVKGPGSIATTEVKQEGIPATGKTVTEIIEEADDAQVETLESTVVALTAQGAVISDGSKAIYVYGPTTIATSAIGDNVKVFGKKTTYNGVPEITDLTAVNVISSGNAVTYPVAKDITPDAATYTAAEAEFVKLTGTLSVSTSGTKTYYNLNIEGLDARQGSIVSPIEALNAASFDTKQITLTGYFNGLSGGKYINIIVTKIEEAGVDNGSTISEILAMEKDTKLESKASLVVALTARGFVATDGTKSVYVYTSGTDFNGVAKIGDKVKFTGSKTVYNGVHEVEKVTALDIVSSGNEVKYPEAKDITAEAATYTAAEAEFVCLTGTLAKSGNYYNINIEGVDGRQGSLVFPIDALDAASFDTKKITVTGYYNGFSNNMYINIIATSIEEYSDAPKVSTLTVSIADVAAQFKWVNAECYQSFEWEGFSFVASGQGEQNGQPTYNGAYNEAAGQWRFYQARAVCTLTMTAPAGKELVSATFTYAITNTGVLLDSDGNRVPSDQKVAISGNSVAFTVGNTSETVTNGQCRFTKIVIEYK